MNKYKKGLTLIETLLSILIISVLTVAFFSLFTNASNILRDSMNRNQNSMLAQSIYESYGTPSSVQSNVQAKVTINGKDYSVMVDVNEYTSKEITFIGVRVHE